jgi:hypothetical protein
MLDFADVTVGTTPLPFCPGADWPDFDRQTVARLWRHGRPVDQRPQFPEPPVETVEDPAVFVCFHHLHFGHFVAEAAPRLPQTLAERPGLPLVFTAWRALSPADASGPLKSVLAWWGVALDRIRFVSRPVRFRRLSVAAQAEHLEGPPPSDDYLRRIEALAAPHALPAPDGPTAYVSRAAMEWHKGAHAGEAYLETCLQALGVAVIRPQTLPLDAQLRAYAGARRLIFAEGSAIHGRQLLGRIEQDVMVLVRRPGWALGRHALPPRVRSLTHAEVAPRALHALTPAGARRGFTALALYDLPALFAAFGTMGLDLGRVWDPAAFAQQRDLQVLRWLKAQKWQVGPDQMAHPPAFFLDQLDGLDLGHLRARAEAVLAGGKVA